jgi:hypothetical protein
MAGRRLLILFIDQRTHALGRCHRLGTRVVFELINIFQYEGRFTDEWIHTDNRGVLRKLGAEGR